MTELSDFEVDAVSGGYVTAGRPESTNVIDARGFFSRDSSGNILWGDTIFRQTGIAWWY